MTIINIKQKRLKEKNKKKLDDYTRKEYLYFTKEFIELRNYVFYIHSRIELSIDIYISDFVYKPYLEESDKYSVKASRIFPLLGNMEFSSKLRTVKKVKKIDKKLIDRLEKLNRIRNEFSHPLAYIDNLENYEKTEESNNLLQFLIEIMEDFDVVVLINKDIKSKNETIKKLKKEKRIMEIKKIQKSLKEISFLK